MENKVDVNEGLSFIYKDCKYKIQEGDRFCFPKFIKIDKENAAKPEARDAKIEQECIKRLKDMIVFENEHVIVINKDNGVPSQLGSGLSIEKRSQVSIDTMLTYYCPYSEDLYEGGRLIHRLDRKTSGLMVLAKNKEMAKYLSENFKEKQIYKAYYALICGLPILEKATVR